MYNNIWGKNDNNFVCNTTLIKKNEHVLSLHCTVYTYIYNILYTHICIEMQLATHINRMMHILFLFMTNAVEFYNICIAD